MSKRDKYQWNYDDREAGLRSLHAVLLERIPQITWEQVQKIYKDWKVISLQFCGVCVGCCIQMENEIHIAVESEHRHSWFSLRLYLDGMLPLWDKYGETKTRVWDEQSRVFISKLGYVDGGDGWWYNRLDE